MLFSIDVYIFSFKHPVCIERTTRLSSPALAQFGLSRSRGSDDSSNFDYHRMHSGAALRPGMPGMECHPRVQGVFNAVLVVVGSAGRACRSLWTTPITFSPAPGMDDPLTVLTPFALLYHLHKHTGVCQLQREDRGQ